MDRDLPDLLLDRMRTRQDLRNLIIDLIQDRQDLRRHLRERIGHWRDRDEEEEEDGGWRGICASGWPSDTLARRKAVISSPGACGRRTGICS